MRNFIQLFIQLRLGLTKVLCIALLSVLIAACSSDEPVSTSLSEIANSTEPGIKITALSTKPWLITGGTVLLELRVHEGLNVSQLNINLNGKNITSDFREVSSESVQALLSGLPDGDSQIVAEIEGTQLSKSLTLTSYPLSGPIISGPQEQPFYCQSAEFQTVAGDMLGNSIDLNCSVSTRVDYVYWSEQAEAFMPFFDNEDEELDESLAEDIGMITLISGEEFPYIVRVETGTVNRAIYEIAMLHDPADGSLDPWRKSSHWNNKLVVTHGGGCRGGWFQQGNRTGGVMRRGLFEQGYAVASSTLNVFGQNCNDLLASETHIMLKELFIEHYGEPDYTIATGASGGSYQSHQTADNYPGVFDGIIVSSSFPDVATATIFTLADARLLNHYFTETNVEDFTQKQQRAISGFGSWASIANLSGGAARLDPIYNFDTAVEDQGGEVHLPQLETELYSASNLGGLRATVYDHTVNVYGTVANPLDGNMSIAQRPLDNVGVQYGLGALNNGSITAQQFINLNRDIGGFDHDMNHMPQRHKADAEASKRAIESGRVLFGGVGLATTPVIDYRNYTDHRETGDIHMIVHQFSTRQRLQKANGHTDNHVMQVGGLWGFTEDQPDLGELFKQMDTWLMAMNEDDIELDSALKTVRNKPASLHDSCWDNTSDARILIQEQQTYTGDSRCNQLYPAYQTPRQVAGAPLANDIISCQLRAINPADYTIEFTSLQTVQLAEIFPQGVCDWSRGDASGARHQGAWASFGPSPVNALY
ncbi:MAG: hypothetical protein COA96_18300 [SAR86 cluster bacterium]|uniref:DUF6351 domain-containing protein n=1 Tax=SAR86 cluster bacterium TaxID=2030880 RepID=A0A2A5AC66_9GAMM|nr:MAG: hypothetical protein COA96_18300 [SAR86 cluster bacterium]